MKGVGDFVDAISQIATQGHDQLDRVHPYASAIRLDALPDDAIILLFGPDNPGFFYAGKGKDFSARRRGARNLPIDQDGRWKIKVCVKGLPDLIIPLVVGEEGESVLQIAKEP